MLLMIDNYDSFTYNIVQYLQELGIEVEVYRNDEITLQDIAALKPEYIVVSPGPCTPREAGISVAVVEEFAGKIPLLGICLGHQTIAQALGGKIVSAKQVMHGKLSKIYHNQRGVFREIASPFMAIRYNSLVIDQEKLPECLEVTAWTEDGAGDRVEIMGIRHKELALEGVQFHPESILSEHGHQLFENFLMTLNRDK